MPDPSSLKPSESELVECLEQHEAWWSRWAEMEAQYGNHLIESDEFWRLVDEMVPLGERRHELLQRYRKATTDQMPLFAEEA